MKRIRGSCDYRRRPGGHIVRRAQFTNFEDGKKMAINHGMQVAFGSWKR
jgi:hypothetical protein